MKNKALINGLWNGLANVVGIVTGVLGSILIVRGLTPGEYSVFSYYTWLAAILGTLGILSFPNAVTKITSELRGKGQVREAQNLVFWVTIGIVILNLFLSIGLSAFALSQPLPQQLYLILIALILVPNGLYTILRSLQSGKQSYRLMTLVLIVSLLLQFVFIVASYVLHASVSAYLVSILSIYVSQAIIMSLVLFWRNKNRPGFYSAISQRLDPGIWKQYFAFALPFIFYLVFEVVVWQRSEIFFLVRLSAIEQVGYYNLAYTFFGMFLGLGQALMYGYFPAISHDFGAKDWTQVQNKVRQGALFVSLFALPVALGSWATAPRLINLLYGPNMEPAVAVARVLFLGLVPGTLAYLTLNAINAVGGVWLNVRIGALMIVLNIAMDVLFIPGLGAVGASIANTTAQIITAVLVVIYLYKSFHIRLPWRELSLLTIIGIGSTLIIPLAIQEWLPGLGGLTVAILVSALVYLALIWKLGYLQLADLRRMTGITA